MANFNTLIKRKQYIWLGLILAGGAAAVGGGLYLSDLNMSSDEEAPAQGEPAPDMTGVVDSSFNSKVEQHATTEMQATAADLNKRFDSLQGEVDLLSKARTADQIPVIVALVLFALATSAFLSRVVLEYSTPRVVAFDMKKTLDSFMDSVSQKQLTEAQSKALSDRFNDALEKSLAEYQQQHHVVILVSPAVVQGAPDVTRNIQHDIARRMKGEE